MGLAEDARKLSAEGCRVVAAGTGDSDERELLGGEESIHECVVSGPAGLPVGQIIEFDATDDAAGFERGDDEADVLVRDQVEGCPVPAFGADFEEVGEADFDRDPAGGPGERFENCQEFPLGSGQEVHIQPHEIRWSGGVAIGAIGEIGDGRATARAAVASLEHEAEREREQGGADEETDDEIRAEGDRTSRTGSRCRQGEGLAGGLDPT